MKVKNQKFIFILLGLVPLAFLLVSSLKEEFGVIGQIVLINSSVFIKGVYDKIATQEFSIFFWFSIIIFIIVVLLFASVILLIPAQN